MRTRSRKRLNAAAALMFDDVQTAFLLAGAAPAAGAFVLAATDRRRAWPATDAGIAAIVQRIVWHIVLGDERPHVALGPVKQRIDFHQVEFCVPLNDGSLGAIAGLILANGANPCLVTDN